MIQALPPPPVSSDVDLTDFAFMPLEVSRLRRSKAWLVCKRRPELAFYMLNLWTAAWHERPAGSLEDDDDVLADVAMCPSKEWPKMKADVMRGWVKCSDGRLYHTTVIEKVQEAWKGKMQYAYDRECGRLRKAAERAGTKSSFSAPTFEEWDKYRMSNGQNWTSNGRHRTSNGHIKDVKETSNKCPVENALKGEGEGEVRDRDRDTYADKCPADMGFSPLTLEQAQKLQATYPVGIYRQSEWLLVEKLANHHIAQGHPFEELLDGVDRYRTQCDARECIGTQYVLSPVKFFDRETPQFADPFHLPKSKAEVRQDSNEDAAATWLARREART